MEMERARVVTPVEHHILYILFKAMSVCLSVCDEKYVICQYITFTDQTPYKSSHSTTTTTVTPQKRTTGHVSTEMFSQAQPSTPEEDQTRPVSE